MWPEKNQNPLLVFRCIQHYFNTSNFAWKFLDKHIFSSYFMQIYLYGSTGRTVKDPGPRPVWRSEVWVCSTWDPYATHSVWVFKLWDPNCDPDPDPDPLTRKTRGPMRWSNQSGVSNRENEKKFRSPRVSIGYQPSAHCRTTLVVYPAWSLESSSFDSYVFYS